MDEIEDVRAFSRFYTRQIGLLQEHFNQSEFSLPEGRVLHEIAARGHTTLAEVAQSLDMDRGYLSRLTRKLVADELIAFSPNPADRRSNHVALTREGDAAYAELSRASDSSVRRLLAPLGDVQRRELVDAMRTIRLLLGDTLPAAPVILRPHRIGDIGWMVHRQGVLYHRQYGWNGEFEALIARIYNEYETAPADPPRNLWVAERAGRIVGSIFVMPSEGFPGSAQLRMLYVEPEARGLGIGATLVAQAVSFARESGYERMRLWTHTIQEAARRLYAAAGFKVVESKAHHQFGKDLVAEIWEQRF